MKTVQRRRAEGRLVWLGTILRKLVLAGLVLALAVCGLSPARATVPYVPPLFLTDVTLAGVVGEAFTGQLTVAYPQTGAIPLPAMPTFVLVAGTLPDGLTLNSDGSITGTPSVPFDGAFTFKVSDGTRDISNTATCTLHIVDNTVPTLLTLSESSVAGSASVTATVTLSGPARAGGLELAVASSDTAASVPATVTVPEGQTAATFEVAGNLTPTDTTVTLSATVNGSTASAQLLVLATTNTPLSPDEPVTVIPAPGITITFPNVTAPGLTTVTVSTDPPPLPAGFSTAATYYDVHTTAAFAGLVTVGFAYDPNQYPDPENVRLLHYENNQWVDVTTGNDTTNHIVYGSVTSLSPFVVAHSSPQLTALGPATIWFGLKNSDDVGTKFDLLAEVLLNGAVVGSGQLGSVAPGSSGFNNAHLQTIAMSLVPELGEGVEVSPDDTLGLRLSARIAVSVTGHRSGTLRLWCNTVAADSVFAAMVGYQNHGYHLLGVLHTDPRTVISVAPVAFPLADGMAGTGPANAVDLFVDKAVGGNPFKPLGTWSIQTPN